MAKIKSIVLLSGGMDSLVTTAIAKKESDEIYFIHANYGQKTESKELECFNNLVNFYQPADILNVDINYLRKIGGSSLVDNGLKIHNHHEEETGVPNTYVPFRNAHLIAIGVSWAEVIGAQRIYIGAVEEDSSGYPDCRESFYESYNKTIDLGTKDETKIRIMTPVIHMTKSEIVKKGKELNCPFEFSWSCYRSNDEACGTCDSCHLRIKAFKEANMKDPIPYKIKIDW